MPHFRIRQHNMTVAQTSGIHAEQEIMHYANQYRKDGELTIQAQHISKTDSARRHWKRFAFLAMWPDSNAVP